MPHEDSSGSSCPLLKYLILFQKPLHLGSQEAGRPRGEATGLGAKQPLRAGHRERGGGGREGAGRGRGGDAKRGQKSAETLHAGSDSLHLVQEAVELGQG